MHNRNALRYAGTLRILLVLTATAITLTVLALLFIIPRVAEGYLQRDGARIASNTIQGSITIDDVSLSWFGTQRITGITLLDTDGSTVATIGSLTIDRSLLNLATSPANLGTITLDNTNATITIDEQGQTNIQHATAAPPSQDQPTTGPAPHPDAQPTPQPTNPPTLPTSLYIHLVAASPINVTYTTPNDTGTLTLDLNADPVTPDQPASVTLSATENTDQSLTIALELQRLTKPDTDTLDVAAAQPTVTITGQRIPRAIPTIAAALTGRTPVTIPANPTDPTTDTISIDAAFTLADGALALKDPAIPARIALPLNSPLLAVLRDDAGAGIELTTDDHATLTVADLNVPLAQLIADAAGWPAPANAPSFDTATIDATLNLPPLAGNLHTPLPDTPPEPFTAKPTAFTLNARPLRDGINLTGNLTIEPQRSAPSSFDINLAATGIRSTPDNPVTLDQLNILGSLRATAIATAIIDPLIPDIDLTQLLGNTSNATLTATVPTPDSPPELNLKIRTAQGHQLNAAALLNNGTLASINAPTVSQPGDLGFTFFDPTPARTINAVLQLAGRPERLATDPDTQTKPLSLLVPTFSIPIDASQPLTEATAFFILSAPRIPTSDTQANAYITTALSGTLDNNQLDIQGNIAPHLKHDNTEEHPAVHIKHATALLESLEVPALQLSLTESAPRLDATPTGDIVVQLNTLQLDLSQPNPLDTLNIDARATIDAINIATPNNRTSLTAPTLALTTDQFANLTAALFSEPSPTAAAPPTRPHIQINASAPLAALASDQPTLDAIAPNITGSITDIPTWLAEPFLDTTNTQLTTQTLVDAVGESLDITLSTATTNNQRAITARANTRALELSTRIVPTRDALTITATQATVSLDPTPTNRALAELLTTDAQSTPTAELVTPITLNASISDITLPAIGLAIDTTPDTPASVNLTAQSNPQIALNTEGAPPRTLRIDNLAANLQLFNPNAQPLEATLTLTNPRDLTTRQPTTLSNLTLSTDLAKDAPTFIAELTGANPPAIDRWLEPTRTTPGPLTTSLGDQLALTVASSLGITDPNNNDAVLIKVESTKLDLNASLTAERSPEGDINALTLARPLNATFVVAPELLETLTRPAPTAPALTLDNPATANLNIRSLTLGPLTDPLDPDRFNLDATLTAERLDLRNTDAPASDAPVRVASLNANIQRTTPASPITIDLTTTNTQGDDSFKLDATLDPFADEPTINATARGRIAALLVDTIAGADGLLTASLGNTLAVDITLDNVTTDRSRGSISAALDAANANAAIFSTLNNGAAIIQPATNAPAPSAITLSRISADASNDLINPLFPLLGLLEKSPDDDPLVLTLASASPLSLPTDGNLNSLNGTVTFDLGTLSFQASQLLAPLLEATNNNRSDMIGTRLEPITVTFTNGVATYQNQRIPIGEFDLYTSARIDLINRTQQIALTVPLRALAEEVGANLPNIAGISDIPFTLSGPIGGTARLELDTRALTEGAARGLLGDLLNSNRDNDDDERDPARDALNNALKDIFGR